VLIAVALAGLVLSACGGAAAPATVVITQEVPGPVQIVTPTPGAEARKLEIFDWWTGPGEKEAADAMFKALKDKYPDIEVVQNPVPGGGGVNQRVVLQARMSAGLPPDTWQTLGGAELKSYVDAKELQPLDDLYKELGYDKVIPGPLLNAVTVDGHPYVIPLNMHVGNILYWSTAAFTKAKITDPPKTYKDFKADLDALKAAGYKYPLALGNKDSGWAAVFILDSLYLELAGPEGYVKFYKGETDVTTDANFKTALTELASLMAYVDPGNAALTWDQSVGNVVNGDSAMVIMGTWAIGAFIHDKWTPGKEFSATTFPQAPDRIILFHPDTFGLAVGGNHPNTTKDWLRVVASPELQIPTDVTQGGLFARTDIDPTKFPDPIRQELQGYVAKNPGKMILDQHGSIAPQAFTSAYWTAIATFVASPGAASDVDAAIKAVATLMTANDVKTAAAWYKWP
jgi:glucose/mannose transport system substrate-binding protein